MTIAAILKVKGLDVVSIAGELRVAEAVALLAERRIGAVPVVDGDAVLGMLSERDILYCLARDGGGVLDQRVDALMTTPVITIGPDQPVIGALSLMTQRRIRHLPVVADGRLVGIVSIGDLVKHRIDRIEAEADAMRDYIRQA